ncbi:MAG: hypothetical protein QXH57_01200 [Sulfolobales archaeon]
MSDVISYSFEDSISTESSYIDALAEDIVRTASVIGILKSIGEGYDELVQLLKFLISELVMELHTTSYVEGLAGELCEVIKTRLWDIEDEFKLYTLINNVVTLGLTVREGINDPQLAREVFEEFADTFSLDLSKCAIMKKILDSGDPALTLQAVLLGLVISVGGLSNDGG